MSRVSAPMFRVAVVLVLFAVKAASGPDAYSKLQVNMRCRDFRIPDVTSQHGCFGEAADSVGLGSRPKLQLDHMGFTGCVFNTVAGILMFGTSTGLTSENTPAFNSWQYLCNGVPTTTTSATHTTTATTVVSLTASTTTALYTKLEAGARCSDYKIPDVGSKAECFSTAMSIVGLHSIPTYRLDYLGFSGCVLNVAANVVMYGVTPGVPRERNQVLPVWQFICNGIPTTTTTTTAPVVTTTSTSTKRYVKLGGGLRCDDQQLQGVSSKEVCFAQKALIGSVASTYHLDGLGFTGCIYNAPSNSLLYGVTPGITPKTTLTMQTWHYICEAGPHMLLP